MREKGKIVKSVLCASVLCLLLSCQTAPDRERTADVSPGNTDVQDVSVIPDRSGETDQQKKDTHEHSAPHGGTLVRLGDEFAHLELVLNTSNGEITAYALDGEVEKSVPLKQEFIEIEVEKPEKFTVRLEAVENTLTGEKRGATSEFRSSDGRLKGLREFDAKISLVTIRGRQFKTVHFNFPKGNEDGHGH